MESFAKILNSRFLEYSTTFSTVCLYLGLNKSWEPASFLSAAANPGSCLPQDRLSAHLVLLLPKMPSPQTCFEFQFLCCSVTKVSTGMSLGFPGFDDLSIAQWKAGPRHNKRQNTVFEYTEFFGPTKHVSFGWFFPQIQILLGVGYCCRSVIAFALMHGITMWIQLKITDLVTKLRYKLSKWKAVNSQVATTTVCHNYSSTAQNTHHIFQKHFFSSGGC